MDSGFLARVGLLARGRRNSYRPFNKVPGSGVASDAADAYSFSSADTNFCRTVFDAIVSSSCLSRSTIFPWYSHRTPR